LVCVVSIFDSAVSIFDFIDPVLVCVVPIFDPNVSIFDSIDSILICVVLFFNLINAYQNPISGMQNSNEVKVSQTRTTGTSDGMQFPWQGDRPLPVLGLIFCRDAAKDGQCVNSDLAPG
jgi:hypothetical protein